MEKWQNPELIKTWILIILGFFTVLLIFIIFITRYSYQKIARNKIAEAKAKTEHQKNLLESTVLTQEKERKRIAADLHDGLIGKLIACQIMTEKSAIEDKRKDLIQESIEMARNISHDLSPPLLNFRSLSELIQDSLDPFQNHYQVETYIDVRQDNKYATDFKIQFLRITQESLSNIMKHSHAKTIKFRLRESSKYTILFIQDDGIGFINDLKKNGLGLKNIETRVQYLNGKFRIHSKKDQGVSSLFIFKNGTHEKN